MDRNPSVVHVHPKKMWLRRYESGQQLELPEAQEIFRSMHPKKYWIRRYEEEQDLFDSDDDDQPNDLQFYRSSVICENVEQIQENIAAQSPEFDSYDLPVSGEMDHQEDETALLSSLLAEQHAILWQGRVILKDFSVLLQFHYVHGNKEVAKRSFPVNPDLSTPPIKMSHLYYAGPEQMQFFSKYMRNYDEHCMLLALPCGHNSADVLQHTNTLQHEFYPYLKQKQSAGVVNICDATTKKTTHLIHMFVACEYVNAMFSVVAARLQERVAVMPHFVVVIVKV